MAKRVGPGRPAGQYTQAVRLFELYHRLDAAPEGMRVDELARELGVTPRSIRRDLAALRSAHQDVETLRVDGEHRVRLAKTGRSSEPIRMTRFQRYSLAAARRMFDVFAGTPLHDDLSQLFDKLAPPPADGSDPGATLQDRFIFIPEAPKSYRRLKDQVYEIYDGVLRNLTLSFQYEGGSTAGTRKLEPYALVSYRNGLYVVGIDATKRAARTFAVERMRRVRALPQSPFERDAAFDPAKLFDGAFGITSAGERVKVVVEFSPRVARYVEERLWHASQKIVRSDRGLRCELNVSVSEELVTWVLRWGADAKVLSPPDLVARVRDELVRAASQYAGSDRRVAHELAVDAS